MTKVSAEVTMMSPGTILKSEVRVRKSSSDHWDQKRVCIEFTGMIFPRLLQIAEREKPTVTLCDMGEKALRVA